ncbi:MAG: hypothetical protein V3V94_02080 [Candidatus Brocadiales bacterium]
MKMSNVSIINRRSRWITVHMPHLGLRPSSQSIRSRGGFSYLTIIIVLALLGIAGGVAAVFSSQLLDIRRERQSRDELADIKQAIVGNTKYVVLDSRGDFGYIGTMGSLPSSLEDLYKKGSQPAYTFSTGKIVGAGWKGPYILPLLIENVDSLKKDPFGNDYVYSTSQYTRSDGEVVVAKITGKGADGTLDTSDDRFVEILKREVFATVTGSVISPVGDALEDASVTLNTPVNGVLTTATTTSDVSGNYSFSDVAFGVASVEVEATVDTGGGTSGLGYVEGSAITIESNTKVQFQISNLGEDSVTVTSITVDHSGAARYYEQIDWSGTVVWDYVIDGGGTRGGPGETKTLSSSQTIVGTSSAAASSTKLLRVEESSTTADTVTLGTGAGTGGQVTITLGPFFTQQSGGGAGSMLSKDFTITFSDGSVVTFST